MSDRTAAICDSIVFSDISIFNTQSYVIIPFEPKIMAKKITQSRGRPYPYAGRGFRLVRFLYRCHIHRNLLLRIKKIREKYESGK